MFNEDKDIPAEVKEEQKRLYAELKVLSDKYNEITTKFYGGDARQALLNPQSRAGLVNVLGEIPAALDAKRKQINEFEEKHNFKSRLSSPSAQERMNNPEGKLKAQDQTSHRLYTLPTAPLAPPPKPTMKK